MIGGKKDCPRQQKHMFEGGAVRNTKENRGWTEEGLPEAEKTAV